MEITVQDPFSCDSHIVEVQCNHTITDVIQLIEDILGYQGIGISYGGETICPSEELFMDIGIMAHEEIVVTQSWGVELQKARKGASLDDLPIWTRCIKPIVWECVSRNGDDLEFASADLQSDHDLVLLAVQQKGTALKYASSALKNDRDIVLEAIRQEGESFYHASDDLRREEMVISEARWSGIMICV